MEQFTELDRTAAGQQTMTGLLAFCLTYRQFNFILKSFNPSTLRANRKFANSFFVLELVMANCRPSRREGSMSLSSRVSHV